MNELSVRPLALLVRLVANRPATDDAGLLARFRGANDPTAFAELVRRYGPLVLGVCRRMLGQAPDADDAFQATFLALIQNARSIRQPNALSAWLYGTAVRVCRKARSQRRRPLPASMPLAAGVDPFEELAWKEVRALLDEEMSRLPDSVRAALVLCYFEGLTRDEAAERLGWSRRTLLRRLELGRDRLRHRLARRGVTAVGIAAAVLSPTGLLARVSPALLRAAGGLGAGVPATMAVRALAGGAAFRLLHVVATLLLCGACAIGLAAFGATKPIEVAAADPAAPAAVPGDACRLDADGVVLPEGAVHRLGSRRFRVEGRSQFILATPDGKHILVQPQPSLSAYGAQGLFLMDADTGLRVRTFEDSRRVPKVGLTQSIRPAAFSPDGTKLYALAWDKSEEAGQRFYVWANPDNPCKRVLLVWDVATGKRTAEWALPTGGWFSGASLMGLTVSPDGKRLFVYGSISMKTDKGRILRGVSGIHVLDAATGERLQTWDGIGFPVGTTVGGKEIVAYQWKGPVAAHDAETGKLLRTFTIAGTIPSVALSPDGKTVAAVVIVEEEGKRTGEIKLWEAATGREVRRLPIDGATAKYWSLKLAFAGDGKRLFLGAGSGRMLRWNVSDGKALPDWSAHSGSMADLLVRPGKGELISAGASDGAIRRWDAADGRPLSTTPAYVGEVSAERTPDGAGVALGDATGRVEVWDIGMGRVTRTLHFPADSRRHLVFSPDGRSLLDATENGKITVRDAMNGKTIREIPAAKPTDKDSGGWCALTFSPDGRHLLASKYGYGTRLLTWPAGVVVWQEPDACTGAFSRDGERLLTGGWHETAHFRDPATGNVQADLPAKGVVDTAFAPDGRRLATAHLDGALRIRDSSTGEVLKEIKGFRYAWSLAFSPSGWLLAAAGDKSVRVFDTASWQEVARFDGHDGTVGTVFFGRDEATLISASAEDGTALVWSLKPPASRESPDPARLWADLAGDGPAVRRAVWSAVQYPDPALKLFRAKWPVPDKAVDAERIGKLIGALDSAAFADRETASAELTKIGRRAEAALRKAATDSPSAEVRGRAEAILGQWNPLATAEYSAEEARELRAVWALELAGTPEAVKLLESWSAAKVGKRLCDEAAAALQRLRRGQR